MKASILFPKSLRPHFSSHSFWNLLIIKFFSYDSRHTITDDSQTLIYHKPDMWSEPTVFGNRAYFRVTSKPAVLSIAGVQKHDAGMYTCRVDYRQSPTVYHRIALEVISKFGYLFVMIINNMWTFAAFNIWSCSNGLKKS